MPIDIYSTLLNSPTPPISIHYVRRYVKFIASCTTGEGYTERHHILPRSMFPQFKNFRSHPWNKVNLTGRQHFIAHWILARAFGGNMWQAFHAMAYLHCDDNQRAFKVSSKTFEEIKVAMSDIMRTRVVSDETREKMRANNIGRKASEETKRAMSEARKGRIVTPETRAKIGLANSVKSPETIEKLRKASTGRTHTEEAKRKMSESSKSYKPTDETKRKISEANKNRLPKFVFSILCPDGSIIITGKPTVTCRELGISVSQLVDAGKAKGHTLLQRIEV